MQVGLPFLAGMAGKQFFQGFTTEHLAFLHQEQAWRRCAVHHRSTLVATGTGSGKTECFLYPILDHTARERQKNARGVKAIIIYPMNALADDQAKRIAELIHKTPAFKGIRAGLFVGSGKTQYQPGKAGQNPEQDAPLMGPDHLITDKEVLRNDPPDILLTNYKMLDFLLIRPRDQALWRCNGPDTLHWLVVDELHTFDGAQGTDLAMLIRRLRHRLQCDPEHLICVGTSATLGNASDTGPLRQYAGQIFATEFDEDAVITERRQGFDDFIGNRVVEHLVADDETVLKVLRPRAFKQSGEAVAQLLPAFFADPETLASLQAGIDTAPGRVRLGEELKKHLLFQSLLRTATQMPVTVDTIADKIRRILSARLVPEANALITALLALVAWARAPHAGQRIDEGTPTGKLNYLVTLRIQLWLQELRRVLATVSRDPAHIELNPEVGVTGWRERLRLPVIQCRHCHTTGWLTLKPPHESRVTNSLETIYASYFAYYQDTFLARIYPRPASESTPKQTPIAVLNQTLCGQCGHLANDWVFHNGSLVQCPHCQSDDVLPARVVSPTCQNGNNVTVHDDACPVCGERGGQLIIGAQTTTIAAHAVERLWSATLNDHKKLILFSDSVQDAAHRAGYIESKTESYLARAGLAKAIATLPAALPWDQALEALGRCYLNPASPLAMTPVDFVARFIPPGMEWLQDWRRLRETGTLPANSPLPQMLCQRLQWRAIEELAHRSDRGRTLSRVGIAVLFPDLADLQILARALTAELREAGGGLETLPEERVLHWAVGSVLALIRAGAIFHLGLEQVAETGDFAGFEFAPLRKHWIPHRGKFEAPRFITRNSGRHGFLHLEERPGNPLFRWAQLALNLELYSQGIITLAYEKLLEALEQRGLGHSVQGVGMCAFGLAPSRLNLYRCLRRLATPSGAQTLWVPDAAVAVLNGLPAWNSPGETFHPESMVADSWWHTRLQQGDVARVIAHEHTGLLEREERVELQNRFMAPEEAWQPWYENLLSATPTLEMGIDIGALSSVMLGGVPPNQASFVQRIGRAGRRDGNAAVFAIADASPDGHDQYYFANPLEMLHGTVEPPAIYLNAAEVLRRQIYAFFFDRWVAEETPSLPDKLSEALDQIAQNNHDIRRFPFNYLDFVNRNEPVLFEAFCRMLGEALRPETRKKLEAFITGTEQQKNLRARFLAFFEETHAERESWKKRRRAINAELTRLRKQPADEQTRAEIDQLEKERAGLGQRILQLNNEYLLEAMTNAGLLPNYAFPEEGVALTTVIHGAPSGGEQYVAPVHRYNRPAHAALAEFAPRNTFFAHKSKVQIDQIDMSTEPPTAHRFCASCHFLTPLAEPAAQSDTCPRCGDGRWADGSQVRPLLRLRRAVANIRRADKTRITETDESRNPRFYVRQLLMNFAAENVRSAWTLESNQAIYGFEFIAGASFHDLNLGQPAPVGAAEQNTVIAGNDSVKTGFSLCKSCGMVQPGGNNQNAADQQVHTPDCPDRHATGTEHLLDRLFLYRRFESECLRIMVPKGFGSGERTTYSFMSALQLGLRKRFGGKVDHLRFETMAEVDAGGGAGKTYILIYDSVPGGTGYLQQLLAGDADTLTEVLAAAHAVIRDCECRNSPELDGCYRCVFHYRQGRNRRHISRAAALEILSELVEGRFQRKPVKCLSEIDINPDFGSELERRFLPAFKLLGGQLDADGSRFPPVQVTQDIKAGKTAYLLAVGSNKYWVDTQVPIEDPASGRTLCQPDFVISATKAASSMRPIAVFVDGWEYHQKTMAGDARKRATLMLRGEYRVWSVTFEDIEAAHKQKSGTDLDSPLSVLATPAGQKIPAEWMPPIAPHDLTANAIALLLRLLGQPRASDQDPLHPLRPVGQHLLMRAVLRAQDITEAVKTRSHAVLHALPEWLRYDAHTVHLHSPGTGPVQWVQWVGKAEPQFMTGTSSAKYPHAGALILNDGAIAGQPNPGRSHWRQWLRLANLLQAVPGVALLTESMLATTQQLNVPMPKTEKPNPESAAWKQCLDEAEFLDRFRPGFEYLSGCGVSAPAVIGAEQEEGGDYRMAEALWEPTGVVLLSSSQMEWRRSWEEADYTVIEEGEQWWLAVESALKGQQP
ncbi:MAG: DEAD/DEAH box helicase [Accumulibacter sp.]